MGTLRCRQTKPEINISFALCRVLNLCVRYIRICLDQLEKSGTRIWYQTFNSMWFLKAKRIASSPIGIACVHIRGTILLNGSHLPTFC